ncbi:MAG: hypothetical protein EHM89_11050 [Acidobacteria bacterium]|nr:MAG: hypothetical protein EHM89_11050 [Acidobacteriota bacterium]
MTVWLRPAACSVAVETALRLTAIALLLRPMGPWYVLPFILCLAALAIVLPKVLRTPATWLALALLVGIRILDDWPLADNHIYLLGYWCLAVALALRTTDISAVLETSSRWLIGLAFALAVLWKALLSPDYLDGRFFRVTVLTDPRFADLATLIGGLTVDELDQNRKALQALPEGAELLNPPLLTEPWRLRALVGAATWGTLILEICVALMSLVPGGPRTRRLRHASLLAFCFSTYAFAPVAGFGWLLLIMGLAQCDPDQRVLRGVYLAAFLLVLVYSEVPWAALLGNWLGQP